MQVNGQVWIASGAVLAALAVGAGAFGAHGLRDYLAANVQTANFETAVRYQMYHALALVLVGLLAGRQSSAALAVSGICFLLGTLIFSGLLYALVFTGLRWLGAIVPIGGTLLIVGWLALAAAAVRQPTN